MNTSLGNGTGFAFNKHAFHRVTDHTLKDSLEFNIVVINSAARIADDFDRGRTNKPFGNTATLCFLGNDFL